MNAEQMDELKRLIQQVARNLPCPICSNHALAYFTKYPLKQVRTLPELRFYLCEFHNSVNVRTQKPRMTFEEHLLIYQRIDFSVVVKHFLETYTHISQTTVTMMLYSFHRQTMLREVNQYFAKNAFLFTN